jgi:hypothetical protein
MVIPGTIAAASGNATAIENYLLPDQQGSFVQDVIEANSYGQLEPPPLQFVPGTLALGENGSYRQTADGTLLINVADAQTYGQLMAASAELNGTLQINGLSQFDVQPGETLTVLHAPQGVTGSFSHIESANLPSLVPLVAYLGNSVQLSFSPTLSSYIGGVSQTLFASVNHLNIRLDRQMQRLRGRFEPEIPYAPPSPKVQEGTALLMADNDEQRVFLEPVSQKRQKRPCNAYIGPIGSVGTVDSRTHQAGIDYWSAGVLAGFDYAWSNVGAGICWEYERIGATAKDNWGRFHIDHMEASLYTTFTPFPHLALNGIVGGGVEWYHIDRHTGTFSTKKTARAAPSGGEFNALLGAEYAFSQDSFSWMPDRLVVAPMASLQYIILSIDRYKERGAGLFDLKIGHQHAESLRSLLGGKVNYSWIWTDLSFAVQADAAWQREYLDSDRSVAFAPLNIVGPAGTVSVVGAGRNTALAGIDFLFTWYDRYGLDASYDYEWNSVFQDHFFYLGFNVSW